MMVLDFFVCAGVYDKRHAHFLAWFNVNKHAKYLTWLPTHVRFFLFGTEYASPFIS